MHATRHTLPGGRWHFQHGPIDLVIQAEGDARVVAACHERAWWRFADLLNQLVSELPALRAPVAGPCGLRGGVARRMWAACAPYRAGFITPMAAVAGAVAQEIVGCYADNGITRAWVNNGGDIALHLAPGQSATVEVVADLAALDAAQLQGGLALDGQIHITSAMPVRGVATSGWRGRSQSLGIADSVTVLAHTAAEADAAATIVANAVNVADPRIVRQPAHEVRDNSDLGDIPVTVDVPLLHHTQVQRALQQGLQKAQALQSQGLLWSALLTCQGQFVATTRQDDAAVLSVAPLTASLVAPYAGQAHRGLTSAEVGSVFA